MFRNCLKSLIFYIFVFVSSFKFIFGSKIDLNNKDNDGRTPIRIACGIGQQDVVKLFLNCSVFKRIDLNTTDTNGCTV